MPLAVRVVGRRLKDSRTGPLGLLVVSVSVVDADEHRVRGRLPVGASLRTAGGDDESAVAEDELRAVVADSKALFESERAAEPRACLGHIVVGQDGDNAGPGHRAVDDHALIVTGGSRERVATYAQGIKDKTAKNTRASARRPAAKAGATAAAKPAPAETPTPEPAAAPAVAPGELQRLRDELRHVNQEISRIARSTRPGADPARHSQLPEKQGLLLQRQGLERKIRGLSKA